MKVFLYVIIIVLSLLAPVQRLDVAKLQPVEAVAIYEEQDLIVLETDTESVGKGQTVQQALENLKQNTAAVVYLDTANYLLVTEAAEPYAKELMVYLKPSVRIAKYSGGNVKEEAKYLDAHAESARPESGV